MAQEGEIIVGLDIGTTKIVCILGEVKVGGEIEVIGMGNYPTKVLSRGTVVDIDAAVQGIREAVNEAEHMTGARIHTVFAGIAGPHISSFNSHGVVAVKGKEITAADMEEVVDQAKSVATQSEREVLHTLVQEYFVDGEKGIKVPLGMSGVRLEANVHVVTSAKTAAINIERCTERANLAMQKLVLSPLASSMSVLTDDERQLGVALVDIGGGTSDIIIYYRGSVVHTQILPIGGDLITHDIAVGMRTPTLEAERIKHRHGAALSSMVETNEDIEVPKIGSNDPRMMSRRVLCDIIEARVEEIFTAIEEEIIRSGYKEKLGAGIVVTGGTSNLEGISELAESIMRMPVRCGKPYGVTGLTDLIHDPRYATAVGMLLYGARHKPRISESERSFTSWLTHGIKKIFHEL